MTSRWRKIRANEQLSKREAKLTAYPARQLGNRRRRKHGRQVATP